MRTELELREQLDKYKEQALSERQKKHGNEANASLLICSVLAYALGEVTSPTIKLRLEKF